MSVHIQCVPVRDWYLSWDYVSVSVLSSVITSVLVYYALIKKRKKKTICPTASLVIGFGGGCGRHAPCHLALVLSCVCEMRQGKQVSGALVDYQTVERTRATASRHITSALAS